MDVVERPQFRFVEGTRAPLLWRSGGRGGHGHPVLVQCRVSREGGAVRWRPGVPQARTPWGVPVAGASRRAWRWAVGQRAPGGWRSLSSLCPPVVRSGRVPAAVMCPPWPGGFWTAGRAAPPPLAQGWGRARAPLVACPWRVVLSVADRPLTPGGRRRMSWMFRPPSGEGPLGALLAARARPA